MEWMNLLKFIHQNQRFGKNPIEIVVKFDGILAFVGIMPPKEHTFKAQSILALHLKIVRWLKKYGYIIV